MQRVSNSALCHMSAASRSRNFCCQPIVLLANMAALEASLAKGASDLRHMLTQRQLSDANQAKLFDNGIDTIAKFAAFGSLASLWPGLQPLLESKPKQMWKLPARCGIGQNHPTDGLHRHATEFCYTVRGT